mmetsp:Transcript_9522/g.26786  ORF Transcript_9522/g.26786 Transcript_9522/m.26786 type:complete len:233 (+) Transcript_9522:1156-1854(+)
MPAMPLSDGRPRAAAGSGRRGVPSCRARSPSLAPFAAKGDAVLVPCCCGCLNASAEDPPALGPGDGLSDLDAGAIFQAGAWPRLAALLEALATDCCAASRLGPGCRFRLRPARPASGLSPLPLRPAAACTLPLWLPAPTSPTPTEVPLPCGRVLLGFVGVLVLTGLESTLGERAGSYIGRASQPESHSCCRASATERRSLGSRRMSLRMKSMHFLEHLDTPFASKSSVIWPF